MAMFVLGVDVGTRSARAGLFGLDGQRVGEPAVEPIEVRHPAGNPNFYEQSSVQIWRAVSKAASRVIAAAGEGMAHAVVAVGFDATCSLVVGPGVAVSPLPSGGFAVDEDEDVSDVILWLCHRAEAEASEINATQHAALRTVGGRVSPEMEMPKLLWLKRNRPDSFEAAHHFFDLADFLTHKATETPIDSSAPGAARECLAAPWRSACTLGCKWNYSVADSATDSAGGGSRGWDDDFLAAIGLDELSTDGHARIGPAPACALGTPVGSGLSAAAALAFGGLRPGIAVSAGAIDAHAGALGCLGTARNLETAAAIIGGTSTCVMNHASSARFVPGVWGPYRDAAVPGLYLLEGGQSATGELIERLVLAHPAAVELRAALAARGQPNAPPSALISELSARALALAAAAHSTGGSGGKAGGNDNGHKKESGDSVGLDGHSRVALLARHVHVYPDFAGNRSPLADVQMRGAVSGLTLDESALDALCRLYVSTLLALCCQLRHVLEALGEAAPAPISLLCCTGGLASDRLFLTLLADTSRCEVTVAAEPNACLLGSAMLGAVAAGTHPTVADAMRAMTAAPAATILPTTDMALRSFHEAKYKVYRRMLTDQLAYRAAMEEC